MTPQQTIESEPTETQSFADWIQANTKPISIGLGIVALGALGWWFYIKQGELKRQNADRRLTQAKQSLSAGNQALAQSDLQKVATAYKGTPAGAQAAMLLAQVLYDQGKPAEGLKALEPFQSASASGPNLAAVWALTGDGQIAQGKPEDAAASFQKAADATSYPGEKTQNLAEAARALELAGKNADAVAIWQKLIEDPNALALRSEAQIRLGELQAKPVGKS